MRALLITLLITGCGVYERRESVRYTGDRAEECEVSCYGWSDNLSDYCKKQLDNCVIVD